MASISEIDPRVPVIEGFTVHEVIGRGGFSRVYRARQHSLGGREVAIKVLDQGFRSEDDRRQFESECLVAGKLDHPNIVRVYHATMTDDARGCIVMERFAGTYGDLDRRLSIPEVVNVGVKISDVLDEAHRAGIVHQDLKPSNLFRSNRGEPALGDFGIATIAGRQTGKPRLTLRYAPPEKLAEGIADAAGDVYSFAATLYELADGRPPFDSESDEALIRSIAFDPTPRLDRSDAPAALTGLLQRCMAKDPRQRPTAREASDELRRIQASVGLPRDTGAGTASGPISASVGGVSTGGAPAGAPPRRNDYTLLNDDLGRAQPMPLDVGEKPSAEAPSSSRTGLIITAALTALVFVGALLVILLTRDGASSSVTTTTTSTTIGDYVVATPPTAFTVRRSVGGFRFYWIADPPDSEIWIHRVGTDDNVNATKSPFTWTLTPLETGNCFEARTIIGENQGLSQEASPTVCA